MNYNLRLRRADDVAMQFSPCLKLLHTLRLTAPLLRTLCALDVAKAFDKTNHFGLYMKLMDRHIPLTFLNVLVNWYSKCFACVRWGSFVSSTFQIFPGVRQDGILPPSLYAVFTDSVTH